MARSSAKDPHEIEKFEGTIYAKENGQIIKPIFKAWMDYNNPATDAKEAKVSEVKVTAEPNYNVQLKSGHDQYVGTIANFDFSQGNNLAQDKDAGKVYGRMQGVGVTIQLRNQAPAKGIRGIEFPKGNIEFDMDVSSNGKLLY